MMELFARIKITCVIAWFPSKNWIYRFILLLIFADGEPDIARVYDILLCNLE